MSCSLNARGFHKAPNLTTTPHDIRLPPTLPVLQKKYIFEVFVYRKVKQSDPLSTKQHKTVANNNSIKSIEHNLFIQDL